MNFYQFLIGKYTQFTSQVKCISFYLAIMTIYLGFVWLSHGNDWLFASLLFFGGWISFTFLEYILHRFWMHDTPIEMARPVAEYHMLHHRQPTEMDIKRLHRILVWVLVAVLLSISIWFSLYLMPVAGFVFGFSCYTAMHWVLHQSWSVKLVPRLHRFHLYHHCKYPNACYGVTVDWWDLIFKTTPPDEPVLLKRVTDFYFGLSEKKIKTSGKKK
jgi:Fatty acid hydroxylase superfamily